MNHPTKPAACGYKHATKFAVRNIVYHVLGGAGNKGMITAVCLREAGVTYEVVWEDRASSWAAECELTDNPVGDTETAGT